MSTFSNFHALTSLYLISTCPASKPTHQYRTSRLISPAPAPQQQSILTTSLRSNPMAVGCPVTQSPTKCLLNCLLVNILLSEDCVNMDVCRCLGKAPSARARSCILAAISASPSQTNPEHIVSYFRQSLTAFQFSIYSKIQSMPKTPITSL